MKSFYYIRSVLRSLVSWKLLASLLEAFGVLWLLVQILDHFALFEPLSLWLKGAGWYFLVAGLIIALVRTWPKFSARATLHDQDISVTVKIGDIFKSRDHLVVGTNTTFDTEVRSQLIARESVQGQFTERYYSDWKALDAQIEAELKGRKFEELSGSREGKTKRYAIGETVKVYPSPGRTAYLVAIADLNRKGNASGTLEKLREALGGLWAFIQEQGDHGRISIPILGTGKTRLTSTRREIITEMIRSFLAACSESTFCKELTIVVHPNDASEYGISMKELQSFLDHECKHRSGIMTVTLTQGSTGVGVG